MSEINAQQGTYTASDGLKIFFRHYRAEPEKARLIVAHGLGEHSGRYGNIVEALLPLGLSIWIPDHRGHGQSEGRRGHVKAFADYLTDLGRMLDVARQDAPGQTKTFLLGHSLGGLIALAYALNDPGSIDGLIISSPTLGVKVEVPVVKIFLGKVMSALKPDLLMGNELDSTRLSHDPEVVKAYQMDPLVHDRVSARWFTEFMSAMTAANQGAPDLYTPVLMQLAGDDYLVDAQAAKAFFEKLTLPDKTLHVYAELYHEIYNEPPESRAQVLSDLKTWVEARL